MKVLPFLCFTFVYFKYAESVRILGVFAFASKSHYILGNSLMKGLAEAGNDVTMISAFEDKVSPAKGSYTNVVLTGFAEEFLNLLKRMNLFEENKAGVIGSILEMQELFLNMTKNTLEHPNVQKLIKSKTKFDVVIVEQFLNEGMKVLASVFDAPLVVFSTVGATAWVNPTVGNPQPVSYVPDVRTSFQPKMTFLQRTINAFLYVFDNAVCTFLMFPKHDEVLHEVFPDAPDFYDIYYDTSLVLLNSHISINQPVPLVPNMVEIGGYHVKAPKKLPTDLQEFLDNAKEGVVYFSMGSNLKSKDLPDNKREALLNTFKKLTQKVLWKWEDEKLPGQPPNVKIRDWMPQQDILAHPNVKLFITHGGLLSTTETIYHGIPILAIPVFGDQPLNAKQAEVNGYALSLNYHDEENFTEEKLTELIRELLDNPTYRNNAKTRSQVFHDRPLTPMQNAVFWVEYVARHRGAAHLRVSGVGMPWYKYFLIDVLAVISLVAILTPTLVYVITKSLFGKERGSNIKKTKLKIN